MGKTTMNPNRGIEHQIGGNIYATYDALNDYLPSVYQTGIASNLPVEAGLLAASQMVTPQYAQLQSDTYKQFAPGVSATVSQVEADRQRAQAAADLSVLQGTGLQTQQALTAAQRVADPEYYNTRALEAAKYAELLGGMDPNRLSGSEMAAIERGNAFSGLNRGTLGTTSPTETAMNAMQFGSGLQTKRDALTKALDSATQFLQPARTTQSTDVGAFASGRSNTANPTNALFPGLTQTGPTSYGLLNNAMGGATGLMGNMMGTGIQTGQTSPWLSNTLGLLKTAGLAAAAGGAFGAAPAAGGAAAGAAAGNIIKI